MELFYNALLYKLEEFENASMDEKV